MPVIALAPLFSWVQTIGGKDLPAIELVKTRWHLSIEEKIKNKYTIRVGRNFRILAKWSYIQKQ
jgi:hypothetical protein